MGRSDTNDRIYSSSNLDPHGKPLVIKLFGMQMKRDINLDYINYRKFNTNCRELITNYVYQHVNGHVNGYYT